MRPEAEEHDSGATSELPSASSASGPALRSGGFFRRVFLWILGMAVLMSAGSSLVYYTRQLNYIEADLQRRAGSLLSSLAAQAEIGAYAGDPRLLELPTTRMAGEPDVVFVAIYDQSGRELVHRTVSGVPPPHPPAGILAELAREGRAPNPLRNNQESYVDHYAPILTVERDPVDGAYTRPGDSVPQHGVVVGFVRIGLSLGPANERLRELLRWGLLLGLGLTALGAAAAYFIAGRLNGPILALARGADEIRSGNLHPEIRVTGSDELAILADSFMRMAARLQKTMAALSELNRNLEAEVQRRTRQLQRAYEFTSVLNAPIDRRGTDPARMDAADMSVMLDRALVALCEAINARGGGVFLPDDDSFAPDLVLRACHGVHSRELLPTPSREALEALGRVNGEPREGRSTRSTPLLQVEITPDRLTIPLVFREQLLGALVVLLPRAPGDAPPDPSTVTFVRQAAAQLAIAVSNARVYARVAQLAYELTERNRSLAEQRDQLRAQRDRIEQQSLQLVSQRDQMEHQSMQLRAQRDQLQEVNRLKSEFLASVSHELRTPLNAIMGYTELIGDGVYGPVSAEAQEALAGVSESSGSLLNLINQILDLARVEAGKMETHLEDVDVYEVACAVIKVADASCRDRPYRVQLRCEERPRIRTDRAKLRQILTNLLGNAVKFTAEGSVELAIHPEPDGGLRFVVADSGIGIRKEHLAIIFEEFRQVDGSSTRRFGGTGLGLAIARRMAELLGGSLQVESEYGKGSTFTLILPPEAPSRSSLAGWSISMSAEEER